MAWEANPVESVASKHEPSDAAKAGAETLRSSHAEASVDGLVS